MSTRLVGEQSFTPLDPATEVRGHTVRATVVALPVGAQLREKVLVDAGIVDLADDAWYPQAAWLKSFEILASHCGDPMLFAIGRQIPQAARFPETASSLHVGLRLVQSRYRASHRNGEIGHYNLIDFDADAKTATMECRNPYPSAFDRGILTELACRYAPPDAGFIRVDLRDDKPSRTRGDDRCTFTITW